jgi:ABC-type transport system substrate-binding protein
MVSKAAFEKNGQAWCEKNPVGTGPFKFVEWVPDSVLKYEKNENYWQAGLPYLDGFEYHYYADETTLMMAFKAGDFDILQQASAKTVNEVTKGGNYNVVQAGYGITPFLSGDSIHQDSPFADIRVRQAMSYAIDQKAIADTLSYGFAKSTNQWAILEQLPIIPMWSVIPTILIRPDNY